MTQRGPIVCATDLSGVGAAAVELAALLAASTNRSLHVVHATGVGPEIREGEPSSQVDRVYRERLAERRAAAEAGLEQARTEAERLSPSAVSAIVEGHPWEEIVEYAERCQASLVCVGPHGRQGPHKVQRRDLTEWILGSTADRVLRHAPCPVLVASRQDEHEPPALAGTWLLAVDFSPQSRAAAALALELSRACGSKLVALHVITDPFAQLDPTGQDEPFPPVPGLRQTALRHKRTELEAFVARELGDGVETRVEIGEPAYAVAAVADELDAALIVMGTHGRTGLSRLFLGSVAERTLRRSAVPVLCARSD